jgi:hypothetical protein
MPHRPQFMLLVQKSKQMAPVPGHIPEFSSTVPSQLSSVPLHGMSSVPVGVQVHTRFGATGSDAHIQGIAGGQSAAVMQLRVQIPVVRQNPERH